MAGERILHDSPFCTSYTKKIIGDTQHQREEANIFQRKKYHEKRRVSLL